MNQTQRQSLTNIQSQDVHAKRPWVRAVARVMIGLYLWHSAVMVSPAFAQTSVIPKGKNSLPIVASPTAPAGQKPIIDAAANGVPIVLIAPPSAGGVSRNQFSQFNVGTNGVILNNSKGDVATELGGIISGNLQLGKTSARIILNEVNSANPSQLNGYIEVAGQKADVVIANPNGIICDGCGFLNTAGRVSLTTGKPEFDAGGNLLALSVRQGILTVGASGLNARNVEQLDLLARGIVIEGEIATNNLQAILGSNKVLYGTLRATEQSGSGAAPKF
ncbi:MAG: filamentous hemagglutinin N-terminal domain-containing protein, partial [Burkholderiales bacterium]|nr:filamentous hemagglutinin N-terminal domain-containing protein [Burkholderiales bacterium]